MKSITHSRPDLAASDRSAVIRQLESALVAEGQRTAELEAQFAESIGVRWAIATGSGSQALKLALQAAGVAPGDEVIMPVYLCAEVLAVTLHLDARPVIVDVAEDYLMSLEAASEAISPRTKALILPYTFGTYRDPQPFANLGVTVIEDCAQFIDPAPYRVSRVLGEAAIFSFEGSKVMTAGEGGMIATDDPETARRLREMKRFGSSGFKLNLYPLSDLQASLAISQLTRLPQMLDRRIQIGKRYFAALSELARIRLPHDIRDRSLFFRLPIRVENASEAEVDDSIEAFEERGVTVRRPVTPLLDRFATPIRPTPTATRLYRETISLPLYPALSDQEVDRIIDIAHQVLA